MTPEISASRDAMEDILAEFDKTVDEEGFIVESESGEPVLTPRGDEVTIEELAGIAEGSEIFIDDNFVSILEYVQSSP